jgi:hypothetical protein
MNLTIFIILALLICVEVYPCDEKHIICSTVCVHEGDELGVMIKDKCYCANSRDVSKIITRVPKNGAVVINKPQPRYFFE